ncbi:M15 family metallopeptidase [Nocardioides abyssi]|uniref:M15 family metallopeptidase n=1 Tax=Nocardioides abyssi TaxID=3058370 RepID=A0ABT8ES43_9ACTN|nr:M15 family metallopeptidase [Nocardioides abyssi]MDN4160914.1 M15 family metallopeptidase [Nocardioides abyssi]
MPRPRLPACAATVLAGVVVATVAGCGGSTGEADGPVPATPTTTATASATASPSPAPEPSQEPSPSPEPGTVPPPWLGTRVLPKTTTGYAAPRATPRELRQRRFTLPDTVRGLPGDGYASKVVSPPPADVLARSTWEPGCPVAAEDLAWLRVTFRGFEGGRHTGELLVARSAADDLARVFADLWDAGFPLEQMTITPRAALDAPPTGDGNGTGAFVCRAVTGGTSYSQHAYGLAIDVNPFQNPYVRELAGGRTVLPELAPSYLDRDDVRPGMITADGLVVRAFARIGWAWGGDYRSLKDFQHFSATGG